MLTESIFSAFIFPETENKEQYPIAFSSFPTLETTSPVSGYSASYFGGVLDSKIDSNPSLVPDDASRPINRM